MDENITNMLVGGVVSLVFGVLFSDLLKTILSAAWGKLLEPMSRSLSDVWDTEYWYIDDDGVQKMHKDRFRLRQYGSYVKGRNEGQTDHSYLVSGRLENNTILTGTWKSKHPQVTYNGTFQMIVAHDGNSIKGKWLGFDNPDIINHGVWNWKRVKL